jgi:tetratricopeptide (TPR) repeat protein
MRDWLNSDDIERLEASARTPKAHRRAAETLTGWAREPNRDDEVTPADLLSAAAWHLQQAGDSEAALDLYRQAVGAGRTTSLDARCLLHAALLEAGLPEEAQQVADEFRHARPPISDVTAMAENFEQAGDLDQAHRWVVMGVNRLDLDDGTEPADDFDTEYLLSARLRIRRAIGFPPDELDRTAEANRARHRSDP